jgi:membrane protein implicated in regulation of membrane protease activity
LSHPEWSDEQKMATFREIDERFKVLNTEMMRLKFDGSRWRLAGDEVLADADRRV